MERKRLSDSDWLFTVLTALVKRSGGELRVGQEDLLDVSKKDFIGLYLDKKDNSILLKLVSPTGLSTQRKYSDDEMEN